MGARWKMIRFVLDSLNLMFKLVGNKGLGLRRKICSAMTDLRIIST